MVSVFSNYLRPLVDANVITLTGNEKPSEVFAQLRIAYNQGVKGIEYCTRLFCPNCEVDDEVFECIHNNAELMTVVRWTNRNITVRLHMISYKTLGVSLRIIDSMLIKLKTTGKLRERDYYELHRNLTTNASYLHGQITLEDLPF